MSERTIITIISIFMIIFGIILLSLEQELGIMILFLGGIIILINGLTSLMKGIRKRV
ncbi:MAG: hypothetical protein N3E39_00685 [Candidatus Methanomethylicia archaeon]|nr:hypothetical protein [Candidatus Methanomethylicia archaeon]